MIRVSLYRGARSLHTYQSRADIILGTSSLLKRRVLVRGVVQHHFDNDPDTTPMSGVEKLAGILQCPVAGMDRT